MTTTDDKPALLREPQRNRPLREASPVYVAERHEIADGEARRVVSPYLPEPVAVINSGGGYYALSDTCSHGAASLSEGWVENCRVACPLHFSEFDLVTGEPCTLPAMARVRTYTVEVRGASVYLLVDGAAPQAVERDSEI